MIPAAAKRARHLPSSIGLKSAFVAPRSGAQSGSVHTRLNPRHGPRRYSPKHPALATEPQDRFERAAAMQADLVLSLRKIGRKDLASKVEACHRHFVRCTCRLCEGEWGRPAYSCSVRLCPWGARKRCARAIRKFEPIVAELTEPAFFVLSLRNCPLKRTGRRGHRTVQEFRQVTA